jgi:hypothetical protein
VETIGIILSITCITLGVMLVALVIMVKKRNRTLENLLRILGDIEYLEKSTPMVDDSNIANTAKTERAG